MIRRLAGLPPRLLDLPVRLSASGPVGGREAWRRYDDLDLWPTWSPQLRRVECPQRRLTAGATGQVFGPLGVTAGFEILAVQRRQRRWSWRVRAGPVTLTLEHGIDARAGGGSTAWLLLRGPAPLVCGYAPAAWYALHRLVTLTSAA